MTMWATLQELAAVYRRQSEVTDVHQNVQRLYRELMASEDRGLAVVVEDMSLFAAVVSDQVTASHRLDLSQISPQMREAFELAYPTRSFNDLAQASPEEIQGYLNGWKGKYFEVLVRDELNLGDWVGDVHLAPGQEAHLAVLTNQPGWDLSITDAQGAVVQQMQLKATASLSYVQEALDRYPDIQVLTTEEVLDASGHASAEFSDMLLSSHISNKDLTEDITSLVQGLLDATPLDDLLDFVPALPFLVVALDEGRLVFLRRKTLAMALASGSERFTASGAGLAVGGALALMDGGVFSLPAVFIVKSGVNRLFRVRRAVKKLDNAVQYLRSSSTGYANEPTTLSASLL